MVNLTAAIPAAKEGRCMAESRSSMPSGGGDGDGRVHTGIAGLDDVLAGGLTRARIYLIEGSPGTGKTTLALQFLLEGQRKGERGMYITLGETVDELRTSAATHGWSLDGLTLLEMVPENDLESEQKQDLFHPAEFELGEVITRILERIDAEQPDRVVLDSVAEMRLLAQSPLRYRREFLALKSHFTRHHCTVLLLDDHSSAGAPGALLHSIVHGVIALEETTSRYGAERRSLRVVKLRGVQFRGGYHDYGIEKGGIAVYPRLVAGHSGTGLSPIPVATGLSELDALLGGGLVPGTNTLLMGPTGTGKTSTATRCILSVLERGDPAVVFMFDEELATFFERATGLGMDLRPHLDTGRLHVQQITPAELSPGQFVHYVRQAVETNGARAILIDSLTGYLTAMPNEQYLIIQMHELLSYLSQHGVLTLVVLGQHGMVDTQHASVDISYLCDTMIFMRYFEAAGAIRRCLSVVKTRISSHEATIREFNMSPAGLAIGPVLHEFGGILSGNPTYHGGVSALMQTPPVPLAAPLQGG
jgi:circadian clock protein KaiC